MNAPAEKPTVELMPLPEMIATAMPPAIPSMRFEQGIFSQWLHMKKLRRMKDSAESERDICLAMRDATQAKLDAMMAVMTWSDNLKLQFERIRHDQVLMFFEQQLQQTNVREAEMRVKLMEMELKKAEAEYELQQAAVNQAIKRTRKKKEEEGEDAAEA